MATIWTGTLVSTGTAGFLAVPKTVYLNAAFVDLVVQTSYVDPVTGLPNNNATQVNYKLGDGAETLVLIFQEANSTIYNSINTQSTVGTNPLNFYGFVYLNPDNTTGSIAVDTNKIWWVEDSATPNTVYMTVYNKTLDNRVNYTAGVMGGAATVQTDINN